MDGRWVKVIIFILLAVMASAVVRAFLDPGLGKPEDARRVRHPQGFSICHPIGWGGANYGTGEGSRIRLAQDRKTGPETLYEVAYNGLRAGKAEDPTQITFQNQPAFTTQTKTASGWRWQMQFEREGGWYTISLTSPIPLEVQKSPYWPFIESFRVEKPIVPATLPAGDSLIVPADEPASPAQ